MFGVNVFFSKSSQQAFELDVVMIATEQTRKLRHREKKVTHPESNLTVTGNEHLNGLNPFQNEAEQLFPTVPQYFS